MCLLERRVSGSQTDNSWPFSRWPQTHICIIKTSICQTCQSAVFIMYLLNWHLRSHPLQATVNSFFFFSPQIYLQGWLDAHTQIQYIQMSGLRIDAILTLNHLQLTKSDAIIFSSPRTPFKPCWVQWELWEIECENCTCTRAASLYRWGQGSRGVGLSSSSEPCMWVYSPFSRSLLAWTFTPAPA